ncbi:MAG: (p)ppGpp synthetase [Chloroflexi bacterium]|nr:MAG: (p)ppGpp synthetase [Chloroflexota bacterium]
MTDLELLIALVHSYAPEIDGERIERAYAVTTAAHAGQMRSSGKPYVTHPLATAKILADLYMDGDTIVAGLLHDVPEDTAVTLEELRAQFGDDVANLVDGVTKLAKLDFAKDQVQAESLRKMFLAMVQDIRVVLIKLADRLHNMRTLGALKPEKQIRIARETLEIYAPLANRLGIYNIRRELEDLALKYLEPEKFAEIEELLADDRDDRNSFIGQAITQLRENLKAEGIGAEITGRPKHIYSIYKKMRAKERDFEHIYDIRAIRCLVQDKNQCYVVLGVVHALWTPIPGEFDDYIAKPKENAYQSLHTAVMGPGGKALEVQIRTHEMHQIAEYGVAAHWRYKEPGGKRDPKLEEKINWLHQLQEWRAEVTSASEYVDALKTDLFKDQVYVFTPKGKIIELAAGATPIDFAYHIHTEVGNRCRGAKVNGKLVALETALTTGDRVEILTTKKGGPSRDWLNPTLGLVRTARAREKIRQYFKKQEREVARAEGRALLEKELHRLGLAQKNLDEIAKQFNYKNVDELAEAIGYADISLQQIGIKLLDLGQPKTTTALETIIETKARPKASSEVGLEIGGVGGLLTRMAQCCKPVPGEEIIGYISRGRGITVHRRDCKNVIDHEGTDGRWIAVTWKGAKQEQVYAVMIEVRAFDRAGLLYDLSGVVSGENVNMTAVSSKSRRDHTAIVNATLEISNANQLTRILIPPSSTPRWKLATRIN